jgi:hypothetical protein
MKARAFKLASAHLILLLTLAPLCLLGCASPQPANSTPAPSASITSNPAAPANPTSTLHTPSTPHPDVGTLITTFGEHRIGNTIVQASEREGKLTVKHLTYKDYGGGHKSTSTSAMSTPPAEWPLHDGWFAYVQQNGALVWLYNGTDKLLIVEHEETPARNHTHTYGPESLRHPVPQTVLKNLQEPLRSTLRPSNQSAVHSLENPNGIP